MAEKSASSNLGKKPTKWQYVDEEIMHLPSRKMGMDAASELRGRREAAEFIQEMAERLNHNVPANRGQINQNCICIAMVHMHRFYVVHPIQMFQPKDIAAACLFMAGKSEECPRKLEHIVEVWFKLKHRKSEVQPPFTDTVRKNGAELIVYLEQVLLQTIGFDLQIGLPHPIVIQNMQKFKLDNKKLINCAYWFATDIIQLTNWCIRYSERTIACICIYIACSWADYEIPGTADAPWFRGIDPEMTEELLNKLTDEFTHVYEQCSNCHARRFIQKAKNGNPSTMPVKSIAQLPPPPPPPVLQQTPKKEVADGPQQQQHKVAKPMIQVPPSTGTLKRTPKTEPEEDQVPMKKFVVAATNSRVETPDKNSTAVTPTPSSFGDQTKVPQIKSEALSPASSTTVERSAEANNTKAPTEKSQEGIAPPNKKKIGLSEYKQRLKIKQEPSDSPASQATPTSVHMSAADANLDGNCSTATDGTSTTPAAAAKAGQSDGEQQKPKRQSFIPDLSNATSSSIGAEALTLPIGIPLVEEKKPKEQSRTHQQKQQEEQSRARLKEDRNDTATPSSTTHKDGISRSHHHHHNTHHQQQQHSRERSHQHSDQASKDRDSKQQHKGKERAAQQHREREQRDGSSNSGKIYLNGIGSSSSGAAEQHRHNKHRERERIGSSSGSSAGAKQHRGERDREREQQHKVKDVKPHQQEKPDMQPPPPPPPISPNGNNASPPPPPPAPEDGNGTNVDLEEGELL